MFSIDLKVFFRALPVAVCATFPAFGQGYYDSALRYGQTSIFGSNRSMGMAGVQMATGADGAGGAANPASPAMMRRSDIQLSLMPSFNSSNSSFLGNEIGFTKSRTPIGSFSMALNSLKDDVEEGDFRGGTFFLSYNRTAFSDYKSSWEGTHLLSPRPGDTLNSAQSGYNSLVSYYLDNVNKPGTMPADILTSSNTSDLALAYDVYLLDSINKQFISVIPFGNVRQKGSWEQKQSHGLWNIGYSINWKDKIYIGASLGIFRGETQAKVTYAETQESVVVNPSNPNYSYLQQFKGFNFEIQKNLTQTARGYNGNLGILAKVSDAFRLGASVQVPSIITITETFDNSITANYNGIPYWFNPDTNLTSFSSANPTNDFNYNLTIPAKYRLGTSYIFGKAGMVGIDLEYTDLRRTKLKSGDGGYNFLEENKIIRNNYKPTVNVKIGGEIRLEDLRVRLGYAYYPTALKSESAYSNNIPTDTHYLTGGLGGRYETWYWDMALVLGFWKTQYTYVPEVMPGVSSKISSTQLRLGVGFFF